jgi:hypothetical protein
MKKKSTKLDIFSHWNYQDVKKLTNHRRESLEFRSGISLNRRYASKGGASGVFTYMFGTVVVRKQGTLEVHFTLT